MVRKKKKKSGPTVGDLLLNEVRNGGEVNPTELQLPLSIPSKPAGSRFKMDLNKNGKTKGFLATKVNKHKKEHFVDVDKIKRNINNDNNKTQLLIDSILIMLFGIFVFGFGLWETQLDDLLIKKFNYTEVLLHESSTKKIIQIFLLLLFFIAARLLINSM